MKDTAELGAAAYAAGKTGGAAAAKHTALVAGTGLTLAAIVVMSMTMPKNKGEFFVALISTVVSSLSGGALVIQHFDMLSKVVLAASETELWVCLAKLGGVFFVAGLPGWVVVRSAFVFTEARKTKGIDVLIRDTKKILQK